MRNTSALRRIDDLGRVVIPKEIRQKLKLFVGATVRVALEDEKIVITGHSCFDNSKKLLEYVVNSFSDFDVSVCVFDNFKLLATNQKQKFLECDKIFSYFYNHHCQTLYGQNIVPIFDNIKSQAIFPFVISGEVCGGMVVSSNAFLQNFDFAKPMHKFLCEQLSYV